MQERQSCSHRDCHCLGIETAAHCDYLFKLCL